MKMHLGLLVVLAGLAMGQRGLGGKPEEQNPFISSLLGAGDQLALIPGKGRIPGTSTCPPPFSSCGSCPCCLGGCVLSKCLGVCESEKVSDDGRCPNNKECDLKGGFCFPRTCPRGLAKIGSCGRSCNCCSKPVEDLVPVRPSEGSSCQNAGVCATRESCHHWQKKDKELNNTRKGSAAYKKLIQEYRSAICNKKEKALCCPEKGSAKGEKNTVGHLFGADISFSDVKFASASNITQVIMYTGRYNGQDNVIVGVKFSYGGVPARVHGRESETYETCDFNISDGEYIAKIIAQSVNIPNGRFSMIYALTFEQVSGPVCVAGNTQAGQPSTFSNEQYPLNYIYGRTTLSQPQMLGSLSFVYYNEETCPQCNATITA